MKKSKTLWVRKFGSRHLKINLLQGFVNLVGIKQVRYEIASSYCNWKLSNTISDRISQLKINKLKDMKRHELMRLFLMETDKTGRFIVKSKITGITYFVEPIDNGKPDKLWGDVDPATNKLTGNYGNKDIGAVKEKDSLITKNNGFVNILTFKGSPLGEIDRRDKMYDTQ